MLLALQPAVKEFNEQLHGNHSAESMPKLVSPVFGQDGRQFVEPSIEITSWK